MPATTEKKHPNVTAAVCAATKEFLPIEKDQVNPHFKSKYSSLSSYIKATKEGLFNNRLAINHTMGPLLADGTSAEYESTLKHADSDTFETARIYIFFNRTSQSLGSAQTYGMRQNIRNLLNLDGEDDDGNAAAVVDTRSRNNAAPPKFYNAAPPKVVAPDRPEVRNNPPAPVATEKPEDGYFDRIDKVDDAEEMIEKINAACVYEPLISDEKLFNMVWDYWTENIRAQEWGDEEKDRVSKVLMTKYVGVEKARQLAVEEQES